jgi:uncharacterized membrane protein SirB2
MNTGELLHLSLVFHIIGLATVGGSSLVGFVMQGQFWKQYEQDKGKGVAVMMAASKVPRVTMIGLGLIILSGVSMMAITHGAFGEQLWFKVKMSVLLIIILNAVIFGRRNGAALMKLITEDTNGKDMTPQLGSARMKMRIFYLIQLSLLVTIFVLSVFKFN